MRSTRETPEKRRKDMGRKRTRLSLKINSAGGEEREEKNLLATVRASTEQCVVHACQFHHRHRQEGGKPPSPSFTPSLFRLRVLQSA